ncbi:MAG: FAD-dependent oxidoreductase, partial [Treponema sp.]|nr:FAD-dependent oxidoreductase [Treponema sp.]
MIHQKRWIGNIALCTVAAGFFFTACTKNGSGLVNDGTFSGMGAGRNGPITAEITVANGKIVDAQITDEDEEDIGKLAVEPILDQFLIDGGTEYIEAVSGATITSNGIIAALSAALDAASGIDQARTQYGDSETDIVIIGAGGAGMTAATEAAMHGARVIVFEKMGFVGGNTTASTGGLNASETRAQRQLGIADTNEQFYQDTMAGGHYKNDAALVRTLVDNSAQIVDWLTSDSVAADLSDVGTMGGSTNSRTHRPVGGQAIGSHLVLKLHEAARKAGAEIRLNNKVTDIIEENGAAVGVRVQNETGTYTVRAKAVIIATGGFGANAAMIGRYR